MKKFRYEILVNVFAANIFGSGDERSLPGHTDVTLVDNLTGERITFGANVIKGTGVAGYAVRGVGNIRDGAIQDEGFKFTKQGKYKYITRSIPVTEAQFEKIGAALNGALGKIYDYSAFPTGYFRKFAPWPFHADDPVTPERRAQACATFVAAIFRMTGHPGAVGDLFSSADRRTTPGLVWRWIDTPPPTGPKAGFQGPKYVPEGPIADHDPNVDEFGIQFNKPEPVQSPAPDTDHSASDEEGMAFPYIDRETLANGRIRTTFRDGNPELAAIGQTGNHVVDETNNKHVVYQYRKDGEARFEVRDQNNRLIRKGVEYPDGSYRETFVASTDKASDFAKPEPLNIKRPAPDHLAASDAIRNAIALANRFAKPSGGLSREQRREIERFVVDNTTPGKRPPDAAFLQREIILIALPDNARNFVKDLRENQGRTSWDPEKYINAIGYELASLFGWTPGTSQQSVRKNWTRLKDDFPEEMAGPDADDIMAAAQAGPLNPHDIDVAKLQALADALAKTSKLRDALRDGAARQNKRLAGPPPGLEAAINRYGAYGRLAEIGKKFARHATRPVQQPPIDSITIQNTINKALTLGRRVTGNWSEQQRRDLQTLFQTYAQPGGPQMGADFFHREILLIAAPEEVRELVDDLRHNRTTTEDRAITRFGQQLGNLMGWTPGVNPSAMQDYRDDLTRRDPAGMAARQHLFDYSQQEPFSQDMVDEQDLQNFMDNMSSVARWRRDLQANNGAIPFDPSPNSYDPEAFAEGFSN